MSNTYWLINLKSDEYIKNSSNKRNQIFMIKINKWLLGCHMAIS